MENTLYWLWVQQSFGTAYDISQIISYFGSAKALYESDEAELNSCPLLKRKTATRKKLLNKSLSGCEETVATCKKYGVHILTPESEYYPKSVLEIPDYPAVLFVRGDVTALQKKPAFAVIGSRTPSQYGAHSARTIVSGLVKDEDALIVSGGALGIDSVAHKAAIESGGKTVLVTGTGFGSDYLPSNRELRKAVSQNGALVSEYPPLTPVGEKTFPQRNRIVSAMSKAVVIIEAAARSGTFSTARHASRQGRDLFVLPGDIESGNFEGSNQLLVEGARPVFSHVDVLSCYFPDKYKKESVIQKSGNPFPNINEEYELGKKALKKGKAEGKIPHPKKKTEEIKENIEKNLPQTISKNAEIVYNIMSDGALTLDKIAAVSKLETKKVLACLTELELEGLIEADGPNVYSII